MNLTNIVFHRDFEQDYVSFSDFEQQRIDQILVEIWLASMFPPDWLMTSSKVIGFYGIRVPLEFDFIGLIAELIGSELVVIRGFYLKEGEDFSDKAMNFYIQE